MRCMKYCNLFISYKHENPFDLWIYLRICEAPMIRRGRMGKWKWGEVLLVNICGSAKCHIRTSFYSLSGQTWRKEFPRRKLNRFSWERYYSYGRNRWTLWWWVNVLMLTLSCLDLCQESWQGMFIDPDKALKTSIFIVSLISKSHIMSEERTKR